MESNYVQKPVSEEYLKGIAQEYLEGELKSYSDLFSRYYCHDQTKAESLNGKGYYLEGYALAIKTLEGREMKYVGTRKGYLVDISLLPEKLEDLSVN